MTPDPAELAAKHVADRLLEINPKKDIQITPTSSTLRAVTLAYKDLQTLPDEIQEFQQYIWIPDASPDVAAEVNFSVNEIASRNEVLVRPVIVAGGELLRYDIRTFANDLNDLLDILFLLQDIAFDDPYFHLSLLETKILKTSPFCHDGVFYRNRTLRVSIPHPYLDPIGTQLANTVGRAGVIFRADWFIEILNTSLAPGRYYDFAGIQLSAPKNITPLDQFLKKLGTSTKELDDFSRDERAALFKSKPTGKQRLIKVTRINTARPSKSQGILAATLDITREQQRAINDPIENLLKFNFAAYEIIADRPNGTHFYVIANKEGQILKEGDPKIAPDHKEIEELGDKVLQPGLSCRRCHGYGDGWQHFDNDITKLLRDQGIDTLAVLDDVRSPKTLDETLNIIARLYSSEPSQKPLGPLELARQQYSFTVSKITLGRTVPFMAETLHEIHTNYNTNLTPKQVLLELGYNVKTDADAIVILKRVFPSVPGSATLTVIGSVKAGIPIQRSQFNRVFADMMVGFLHGVPNVKTP